MDPSYPRTNDPFDLLATLGADIGSYKRIGGHPDLSDSNTDDIISVESLESLVEGIAKMKKRQEILRLHTAPIKQLPNGRWYTRINGKKIERKAKKELEDEIIKAYGEETITLSSIWDNFLERRKKEIEPTTWKKDIQYNRDFLADSELAGMPVKDIGLTDGYRFIEHCLKIKPDMTQKYWSNLRGFLNHMFQFCIDQGYINQNPFANLRPKKGTFAAAKKVRDCDTVFSQSETETVCSLAFAEGFLQHNGIPLGIVFLFQTGIRDGELCALKWGDIETSFKNYQQLHVQREMVASVNEDGTTTGYTVLEHCKTPAGDRRIRLNKRAVELLGMVKQYNREHGIPTEHDDYIFQRIKKGEQLLCSVRSFDPRLRRYCREAGMKVEKSPHDIRRTVLTNLYLSGMPLKQVQSYAGHSTLKQTMDYIRISDDEVDLDPYLASLEQASGTGAIPMLKAK